MRAVVVDRHGLRLNPASLADLTTANFTASNALERATHEAFPRPVGPPHEHFVKLAHSVEASGIDAHSRADRLCWAILTRGYATRPLRAFGPGHPNPTRATPGVGTNLILIDAVAGTAYGMQREWATPAEADK
jgi:hypothetical protein